MKNFVSLVAVFALLIVTISSVSAFASISSVEVGGIQGLTSGTVVASFSGDTMPVLVLFNALQNASDVRVKAWISGSSEYSVSSERFDVISGSTYSKLLAVTMPKNIDPTEPFTLQIEVESRNGGVGDRETISLRVQRESYNIQILDVDMSNNVKAGENLALDIVLKNRGMHLAEDTFVRVSIPALAIEERAYFGDLSAVDQSDPDKEDAVERVINVNLPANVKAGIYTVEVTAFNADSEDTVVKKIAVSSASEDSLVASNTMGKTFALNEKGTYSLTLVNAGSKIALYELSFDAPNGLSVKTDSSVIVVPAGSSETVKFDVSADKAGTYSFAANILSNGDLVSRTSYTAEVEGRSAAANATVILTVVLAIVFIVLLVVLIVLLTKKPQKTEEFGESYY